MTLWIAITLGALGCYLLKYIGLSVPESVLADAQVLKVATLLPVALLTALLMIQTVTAGHRIVLDERAAGLGAALVAVALRAPFLVVVVLAAATTAGLRLLV